MNDGAGTKPDHRNEVAATGSAIGAVLASSCCIGPLILITLGASGPWIGKLTALKAYQPLFVVMTLGFLGYGFWRVYGSHKQTCETDCETPRSERVVKSVLWLATALTVVALTTDYWAPLFY